MFGTFNAGVLLSVMFQAIIVSIIFAICIKCLLDFGMPRFYFLFMIVFLGLNPIIQLFVFCTTKDVLCSSFVILYVSLLFSTSNNETISKRMTVILALLVFLIAALRSNAAIALLLSAPIQLLLMSKKIRNRLFRKLDGVDFVRQPAILVDPPSIANTGKGTANPAAFTNHNHSAFLMIFGAQ